MVRARFCELLSPKIPHGDSDLFLMGLLVAQALDPKNRILGPAIALFFDLQFLLP